MIGSKFRNCSFVIFSDAYTQRPTQRRGRGEVVSHPPSVRELEKLGDSWSKLEKIRNNGMLESVTVLSRSHFGMYSQWPTFGSGKFSNFHFMYTCTPNIL